MVLTSAGPERAHAAVSIRFANIAVFVPLSQAYTFFVPEALESRVVTGARIVCKLRGRQVMGVVLKVGLGDPGVPPDKLKPILAVVDSEPAVPNELLGFACELAAYYLAPIGEVMRLAVPAIERSRADELQGDGLLDERRLNAVGRSLQHVTARPASDPAATDALKGQAKDVWLHLTEHGTTALAALCARFKNARAAVKKLQQLGLAELEQRSTLGASFFTAETARDTPPELNDAQRAAVQAITEKLGADQNHAFLLDGVTASGKTEVYLRAVQSVLERGGSALVLVPEIALTPQLVGRFRARLGDTVAVLHSGLTERQRYAMWALLRSGERRVAVGARSALFAPVQELRLICVDEEQDTSFKQEEGVRYNARDMALLRAQRAGAVCVLGSATPSLKSAHAVKSQKLTRLVLPDRAHRRAVLPEIEIVDVRRIGPARPTERWLSLTLCRALEGVLERKEQAILFLNRRGFAPSVSCESCGHILGCPSCEVALTYHVSPKPHVICHYCDYKAAAPTACSACKSRELSFEGVGTERVESALISSFPGARVARLDRDTGAGLKSAGVLGRMQRGELDIMVGTQMVTKGHDLPNVSLVGVLNADAGLSMPDYQASERTFQLLVQVAGRAGRGDTPGRVLIQTKTPTHPAIALAVKHDVKGFVEYGLADRESLGYPPFSRLALVRVSAIEQRVAAECAADIARIARRASDERVEVLGPSPAPITRLRSQYRFRVMVRCKTRAPLRHVLGEVMAARMDRRARVTIDIDPINML